MTGETPGFDPQEEKWFKKGEEMKHGEKLPTEVKITAEADADVDVAETETEKDWFKKAA